MAPLTLQSTLKLNTGAPIPLLGFGVWDSPSRLTTASCLSALKSGYRHIDTAQAYGNEAEVGAAIAQSGLPRKDIFVTSKIVNPAEDDEATYRKVLESVEKIGGKGKEGYLDLMLIHNQACGAEKVKMMWLAMEKLRREGRIKAIGVSNFGKGTIEAMRGYASVWPPSVNQLEVSLFRSLPPPTQCWKGEERWREPSSANDKASSTPTTNNPPSPLTAQPTTSRSKPIAPSSGIRKPQTRYSPPPPPNIAPLRSKSCSDTVCKRTGFRCPRAIMPDA